MKATCGSCTLCCRLLGVPKVTEAGSWCRHCTPGKGCGIYADRPQQCRDFECGWLGNNGDPRLRPDKIHMVVTGEDARLDAYFVHVDPAYSDAPTRPLGRALLKTLTEHGRHKNIVLVTGNKRRILAGNPEAIEQRLLELQDRHEKRTTPR